MEDEIVVKEELGEEFEEELECEENGEDTVKEEQRKKFFKKITVVSVAVIMIILVLSYYLSMPGVSEVIVSLAISSTVKDNQIEYNSTNRIVFIGNTYEELIAIYDANYAKEFKVCLKGYIDREDYYITELYKPKMYVQRFNRVVSEPCPADCLIDLHSHPELHCIPSDQDIKTFLRFKERQPKAIMAIMCERNRMNFYE